MKRLLFIVVAITCFICTSSQLQAQRNTVGGNALGILIPSSEFSDTYVVGLNLNGNVELELTNSLKANIEAGVQSWSPQELIGGGQPDEENSFSIGAGGKYFLNNFFLGADAVYYFGNFTDFTVVPNLGLRFGKFNFEFSTSAVEPITYIGFEIGYFWVAN